MTDGAYPLKVTDLRNKQVLVQGGQVHRLGRLEVGLQPGNTNGMTKSKGSFSQSGSIGQLLARVNSFCLSGLQLLLHTIPPMGSGDGVLKNLIIALDGVTVISFELLKVPFLCL